MPILPTPNPPLTPPKILMMGLDPALMSVFSTLVYSSAEELTKAVGLRDLFPEAILDAKIFDPCGYSLNAIVKVGIW